MGKSPGKWIKTLLFGKKASRSTLSKDRGSLKATNEKERWITGKGSTTDSPVISNPFPVTADRDGRNSDLDRKVASGLSCNSDVSLLVYQGTEKQEGTVGSSATTYLEKSREEQAAVKVQAAFRGYLARRAFRALRGIIRLQALVRGHLVRRQATATLHCLLAIVRLQAVIRGRRVRLSDIGIAVNKKFSQGKDAKTSNTLVASTSMQTEKLLANLFACKILASSTVAMPLWIQYSQEEPNSAWNWLERWTSTCFWNPPSQPKKFLDSKSRTRQGASHASETEPGRPKRNARRNPAVNSGSGLTHSESEKAKRNPRKVSSYPVDQVQENPQNELEKVKRSLRKVSNSTAEASSNRPEADTEKPKRNMRKDQGDGEATEKMKKDTAEVSRNQPEVKKEPSPIQLHVKMEASPNHPEMCLLPLCTDVPFENLNNDQLEVELPPQESSGKDVNVSVMNGELGSKEDQTCNGNQNIRRRASFPVKSDYAENGLQSNPTLPSYMMATESAKAKLRGQGSPKVGPDGFEKNGFTRRHSLPSAVNGKVSSLSPRTQRLVQASSKVGIRNDRSLLASRDGTEKVIQVEWRR